MFWIVALACSVVVNLLQLAEVSGLNKQLGAVQTEARQARGAAQQCDTAVQQLQDAARERVKQAEAAREEAQRLARVHRGRADLILAAPPAAPGNDCKSAGLRLDSWWEQRK